MYYIRSLKRFFSIFLIVILLLAVGLYLRPLPALQAQSILPAKSPVGAVSIPWPDYGQEAFGAMGYGVLATSGQQKSAPIASIAKIVTALSVLRQKPLSIGQQGPQLTIGPSDVALYNKYVAEQGSVVPVNDGEQISEYQMLEALLLPSGNNIADSLANWAFGSQSAYLTYANNLVKTMGMNQTHLADASGFSPNSTSSASDLVILGQAAIANPVLASIVSQKTAVIPVAGTVHNVNWLLGIDGANGIKTGNTDQAGGCFLFAAKQNIGGQTIQVIGAVLGAPDSTDPTQAIDDSQSIIEATGTNFHLLEMAKSGQSIGKITAKWGASSPVVVKDNFELPVWNGSQPKISTKFKQIKGSAAAGANVGTASITSGQKTQTVQLVLQKKIPAPSPLWRIFHV